MKTIFNIDNFDRAIRTLAKQADIRGGRQVTVVTDPATHSITITAINDISWRKKLAEKVLAEFHARYHARFVEVDQTVICVLNIRGWTKVGYATCFPDDQYDRSIGRAIAYQRALYGKANDELMGK